MIKLKGVSKHYKNVKVIHPLHMSFDKGKTYFLYGINGCGKSTLIKMILSLVHSDEGSITLAQQDIGYIPEKYYFPDFVTIKDFLRMLCMIRDIPHEFIQEKIQSQLNEWNIDGNKRLMHCSKGMAQKVVIIQALIHTPKLYVFDEPWNGLDLEMQKKLTKTILYLQMHKKTIIITSHERQHMAKIPHLTCTLHQGIMKCDL